MKVVLLLVDIRYRERKKEKIKERNYFEGNTKLFNLISYGYMILRLQKIWTSIRTVKSMQKRLVQNVGSNKISPLLHIIYGIAGKNGERPQKD